MSDMRSNKDLKGVAHLTNPNEPAASKRQYKAVTIQIPMDEWQQFKELYPMKGAATWFCREAFRSGIRILTMHDLMKKQL